MPYSAADERASVGSGPGPRGYKVVCSGNNAEHAAVTNVTAVY